MDYYDILINVLSSTIRLTIPLIFTILPCLFIAVMGPAAISIMDSFGG